jgi:transcriptional regulator of acetoin/glycerol metabolism
MEYAFVLAEEGNIQPEHLPRQIRSKPSPVSSVSASAGGGGQEKQALMETLVATGGNQTQAARLLGINRVTVWNRMRKYGIDLKKVIARA